MRLKWIVSVVLLTAIFGCGNPAPDSQGNSGKSKNAKNSTSNQSTTSAKKEFPSFYVYADKNSRGNHYIPSGFMPNGKCISFDDTWTTTCHKGASCVKVVYDLECSAKDEKWAGIYWLNPANNWGNRKGGYDLTGAQKLVFWAKGEKGGEQVQEFTIGGISGNYSDSDISVMGPVILTPEWREYTIDLRGKDLSYISGGFSWTTSAEVNFETCVFYLDEIRFE